MKVSGTSQHIQHPPLAGKQRKREKKPHQTKSHKNPYVCTFRDAEHFLMLVQHVRYIEVQVSQQWMQINYCKLNTAYSKTGHLAAPLPYNPTTQGSPQSLAIKKTLSEDATAFVGGWGQIHSCQTAFQTRM